MLGQNGYVNGTMTKDETIKVQAKYHRSEEHTSELQSPD